MSSNIAIVKDSSLFKSQPDPRMFGNSRNPTPGSEEAQNWNNENWLKSRFHFSFAEYRHGRPNFGPLRVANDDLVQPKRGFGTHPHANMEIVTYIVDGNLTHQDSMGTAETLTNGDVQFMTAGSGVRHSEHNLGDKPLRFIQMWFNPRQFNLKPNYGSFKGDAARRHNQWHHILTDVAHEAKEDSPPKDPVAKALAAVPIKINQDVNIFVTSLDKKKSLPFKVQPGRQAYVLCLDGDNVSLAEDVAFSKHDAATVTGGTELVVQSSEDSGAYILLVEVAQKK